MLEVIEEALIDSFKLLPFLFITYLIMEYIEHKTSKKSKEVIKKLLKDDIERQKRLLEELEKSLKNI